MPNPSLYEILEVSPSARPAVIRAAYRCLVQEYHPDKNPGDAAAAAHMSQINQAYAILVDPLRRDQYDRKMQFRPADRRGSEVASNRAKPGAGKDRQNLRPFAFRPLK